MNTMKGFYVLISAEAGLRGSYLEALAKLTRIHRQQTNALKSDLGWQEWTEQQETATRNT